MNDFFSRHRLSALKAPRVIARFALGLLVVSALLEGARFARRLIEDKVDATLIAFQTKSGIELDVQGRRTGFGTARFDSLSMRDGFDIQISQISASVNLNPLSAQFGRPDVVRLGRMQAKVALEDLSRIFQVFASERGKKKRVTSTTNLSDRLPARIIFQEGVIIIRDDQNRELLTLAGLHAEYDKDESIFSFRLDRLDYNGQRLFGRLSGRIIMDAPGEEYPFVLTEDRDENEMSGEIRGRLRKDFTSVKVFVKRDGLPEFIQDIAKPLVAAPESLHYAARLGLQYNRVARRVTFAFHAGISNLKLEHPRIASRSVGPFPVEVKTNGSYGIEHQDLRIEQGVMTLRQRTPQPTQASLRFAIEKDRLFAKGPKETPWNVTFAVPETGCQDALNAVPSNLAPMLQSFRLDGTFAFKGRLSILKSRPEAYVRTTESASFNCRVTSSDYAFTPEGIFRARLPEVLAKRAPDTTPITFRELSPWVMKSFAAAEDAGFMWHKGFEWEAMEAAMRRNLKERDVILGGSTISMQTVKNLYLNHDRTLARKLQETFLTWHLEEVLPKEKIFEVYANIVEFGPNLYGIRNAARHMFGKAPGQLSIIESAYLASVLPSPVKRYRNFCRGDLTPNYRDMLEKRLERMLGLGFIDARQFSEAARQDLVFAKPPRGGEECVRLGDDYPPQAKIW